MIPLTNCPTQAKVGLEWATFQNQFWVLSSRFSVLVRLFFNVQLVWPLLLWGWWAEPFG